MISQLRLCFPQSLITWLQVPIRPDASLRKSFDASRDQQKGRTLYRKRLSRRRSKERACIQSPRLQRTSPTDGEHVRGRTLIMVVTTSGAMIGDSHWTANSLALAIVSIGIQGPEARRSHPSKWKSPKSYCQPPNQFRSTNAPRESESGQLCSVSAEDLADWCQATFTVLYTPRTGHTIHFPAPPPPRRCQVIRG